MMTRFQVDVWCKENGTRLTLSTDSDQVLIPVETQTLCLTDGISTEIFNIAIAPTMDPCVFVRGKMLTIITEKDFKETLMLCKDEGWRVVGNWDPTKKSK